MKGRQREERDMHTHTNRQEVIGLDKQIDRQTDKQTDRLADREKKEIRTHTPSGKK